MPPLTGTDAVKKWIVYEGDELEGTTRRPYKVQMSQQKISWLVEILGAPTALIIPAGQRDTASGVANIKPRYLTLSNGTKRVTVRWPFPETSIWLDPIETISAVTYTLAGYGAGFRIVGRKGERNSLGVQNFAG